MSNTTELKAAFEESMNVMKDSISAMLWKRAGRSVLDMLHHNTSLSTDLMTTGAMMTAAAYTDKESAHGKLARDIALGMGLATFDQVFAASREALSHAIDPTSAELDSATAEAEMNLLFNEGQESLEQAASGNTRFSKEKESKNVQPMPAASVTPANAVVISRPGPVPTSGAVSSNASTGRPACPKCGKRMKASKINKMVKVDNTVPEDIQKLNGVQVCQACYSEITGAIRASKAASEAQVKKEKELLEARDNLVKTNEALKTEEERLKTLTKAHEAVKDISEDVAKSTMASMEECRKCVAALSQQRDRLNAVISA